MCPVPCAQEEGGAINRMSSTRQLRQATADSERLTACMARFNLAPWAGLTMLFESGLLRRDPKDIALFLKTNTYDGDNDFPHLGAPPIDASVDS